MINNMYITKFGKIFLKMIVTFFFYVFVWMITTLATNKNSLKNIDTRCAKFSFGLMYGRLLVITPSSIQEKPSHFNSGIKPQTNPIINMGSVSLCTSDNDLFSMQHT
jgi:hypothetical protein